MKGNFLQQTEQTVTILGRCPGILQEGIPWNAVSDRANRP
jgi:hypothetical protein